VHEDAVGVHAAGLVCEQVVNRVRGLVGVPHVHPRVRERAPSHGRIKLTTISAPTWALALAGDGADSEAIGSRLVIPAQQRRGAPSEDVRWTA
jgi:hypothetical protein